MKTDPILVFDAGSSSLKASLFFCLLLRLGDQVDLDLLDILGDFIHVVNSSVQPCN